MCPERISLMIGVHGGLQYSVLIILLILTINVPVVFMARYVMVLRGVTSFRGALEGVGPENRDFFGPKMARVLFGPQIAFAYRLVLFHRGPQNSRFPAPTPPPQPTLPHVIYLPASKTLRSGRSA
jgi:hypothetical protein